MPRPSCLALPVHLLRQRIPMTTALCPVSSRLLRQLANAQATIEQLFSLGQQTTVLYWKLNQVEELLLDLPDDDQLHLWRGRLAKWWTAYAQLALVHCDTPWPPADASPPRLRSPSEASNKSAKSARSQSSISSRSHSSSSWNPFTLSRSAIRRQMANAMAVLAPIEDDADLDALKALRQVLSTAPTGDKFTSANHLCCDVRLQEDLLAMALPKLSATLRDQFQQQYSHAHYGKTLWALDDFLKAKMATSDG